MNSILIGFLGRGPYSPDGQRRPYWKTKYLFPEWTSDEVSFFLPAALQWLRHRGQQPNRLVVLGTSGSMWDGMLETLCRYEDEVAQQRVERLCLELIEPVDAQEATEADVANVSDELSRALGVEVKSELIPAGRTTEEQAGILNAMQRHVAQGDRVYLDVTHGYRHQPMLALGAAILLSQIRRARVEEILYGANDMRQRGDALAPVIRLRWVLELLDWANCAQQLRSGGGLHSLPRVIQDSALEKELSQAAFLLSTNQVHRAGEAAKASQAVLAQTANDPILELTRPTIEAMLEQVAGSQRDARGILAMARSALGEDDYVRTSIFLVEAITKANFTSADQEIAEIKALRNALCHARRDANRDVEDVVKNALKSRTQMRKTLEGQLHYLETQVRD